MNSKTKKAASFLGLTAAGLTACIGVALVANGADPQAVSPSVLPAELPSASAEQPAPAKAAEPTVTAEESSPPAALDPDSVARGKLAYEGFCAACHGPEGNDIDSPSNLFDTVWYHGSGREGIESTIRQGILEKGMPGWEGMIPDEEITALVDYLMSFQAPAS